MEKRLWILCFSLITLSSFAGPPEFIGKAVSAKDGKHLYTEYHQVEYSGDKVKKVTTIYKNPKEEEIGRLVSEFSSNFQLPNSTFTDKRRNYKEVTELQKEEFLVKTINAKGKEQKDTLEIVGNLVCGQGYHNYIITNMDAFKIGETKELRFIIPSMRDYFTFDLTYLGPLDSKKPDEVSFRLDITNWILKMFADKIQVTYSKKDKALLRYAGLTNIKNNEGDQYDAVITYTFPQGR